MGGSMGVAPSTTRHPDGHLRPGQLVKVHSLNEYVEIAQVTKAARMLVDVARRA